MVDGPAEVRSASCRLVLVVALSLLLVCPVRAQMSDPTRQLFQAVDVNDMAAVQKNIADGADLKAKDVNGMTAADLAVDKGHFIIAHYLLSEGAKRKSLAPTASSRPVVDGAIPQPPLKVIEPAPTAAMLVTGKKSMPALPAPVIAASGISDGNPDRFELAPRKPQAPVARRPVADPEPAVPHRSKAEPVVPDMLASAPPESTPAGAFGAPPDMRPPEGLPIEAMDQNIASGSAATTDTSAVRDGAARQGTHRQPAGPGNDPLKSSEPHMPDTQDLPDSVLGQVGTFFKNLVASVTPETVGQSGNAPKPLQKAAAPTDLPGNLTAGTPADMPVPDLMETVEASTVPPASGDQPDRAHDDLAARLLQPAGPVLPDAPPPDPVGSSSDLAPSSHEMALMDAIAQPVTTDAPPVAQPPADPSSADRTFNRIKNLLSPDKPKEDEFGLPVIDPSSPQSRDAVESVLSQLDGGGNLDDPPGPETGPVREPVRAQDTAEPRAYESDAMRARLQRIDDAMSRTVTVDTAAILAAGRRKYSRMPAGIEPNAIDVPAPEQASAPALAVNQNLTPRSTPAARLSGRVDKIRRMENPNEKPPVPVTDVSRQPGTGQAAAPSADKPPTIVDRLIGFFSDNRDKTPGGRPSDRQVAVRSDYRSVPDAGQDAPVPDTTTSTKAGGGPVNIANLQEFQQPDETRPLASVPPGQERGDVPPQFLNQLSGLFNDQGSAREQGWAAKIKPAKATGAAADPGSSGSGPASPWVTTSRLNVGADRPMAVVKVTRTDIPEPSAVIAESHNMVKQPTAGESGQPYADPLKAPDVTAKPSGKAFFSRLTDLFQPKNSGELPRDSLLLEPDEKLSTTYEALRGDVKVASRTTNDGRTYWPITELTKADPPPTPTRSVQSLTTTSLSGVTLTMGESVNLENTFPPGKQGRDQRNQCVKKNRGTTLFCIEPVDWPAAISDSFQIATILYTGPMAITRFDQGTAVRFHSLFKSDDLQKVIDYYKKRLGEPTEIWNRSIAPLAQPRQDNPTVSWRNRDPETNAVTILEIRKYDDARGGFPDTRRGVVMLYYANSPTIFPQVSAHELMQLKRVAKKTETEAEMKPSTDVSAPPKSSAVSPDELFGTPVPAGSTPAPATNAIDTAPPASDNAAPTPGLDDLLRDSNASPSPAIPGGPSPPANDTPALDDLLKNLNPAPRGATTSGQTKNAPSPDPLQLLPADQPALN